MKRILSTLTAAVIIASAVPTVTANALQAESKDTTFYASKMMEKYSSTINIDALKQAYSETLNLKYSEYQNSMLVRLIDIAKSATQESNTDFSSEFEQIYVNIFSVSGSCEEEIIQNYTYLYSYLQSLKDFVDNSTDDELLMLMQLVYHEANNQELIGQTAIANVVLNRCHSDNFPNTIEEVILAKGQFTSNLSNCPINSTTLVATLNALLGDSPIADATYYANLNLVTNNATLNWFFSLQKVTEVGAHTFYK